MSGSTARKVQPFTISTKLSLPKCSPDFPGDGCPSIPVAALDNHGLHQNLNEQVSRYLAQTQASPGRFVSTSPVEELVTNEDTVNRNSLSRSIRKITLSSWHGEPSSGEEGMLGDAAHTSCERNCNNNNCRAGRAQFKVAGCAAAASWKETVKNTETGGAVRLKPCLRSSTGLSKPSSLLAQFSYDVVQAEKWVRAKLRDVKGGYSIQEWERESHAMQRDLKDFENTMIKLNQMSEQLLVQPNLSAEPARRQLPSLQEQWQLLKQMAAKQSKVMGGLRNLQEFNQKAEQLEAWIRQKKFGEDNERVRSRSGSDPKVNLVQHCVSYSGQQDAPVKLSKQAMKTVVRLLWQLEFGAQEEKPLLSALLQENTDKIQLTRRILDLKQEEQQFQVLHEEINSLAHKLEKQGKSESRNIMARRKHLNKMWLRLQGTLKEHHETLQLALEAAAFLQQAEVLLEAIHAKWRSLSGVGKQRQPEPSLDLEVRDLASQVMMLDVTVSQLTSLHPSLVARVSLKHQEVKDSWAQLQQLLRNEKPTLMSLTRRSTDTPSSEQVKSTTTNSAGREAGEKPAKVPGWGTQKDVKGSMARCGGGQEDNPGTPGREAISSDSKRRRKLLRHSHALKDFPPQKTRIQDSCQTPDGELRRLLPSGHTWSPQMEDAFADLEELWAELKRRHQENGVALKEIDTALRLVGELEEVECWLEPVADLLSEPTAMKTLDDLHGDLQKIGSLENQVAAWSIKLQLLQDEVRMEPSSDHTAAAMIQRKMERMKEKLACVQEALRCQASDLHDSLVLNEFLQNVQLEEMLSQSNQTLVLANQLGSQDSLHLLLDQSEKQLSNEDLSKPLKELQEAVEMLNNVVKERAMEAPTQMENLDHFVQEQNDGEEIELARFSSQLEAMRGRAETLAQDLTQAEKSFPTVKSERELQDLQDLLRRQQKIESDMSVLEQHIEKHYTVQRHDKLGEIQEMLEAWKELQKMVLENAVCGQQAVRLRRFFRDYLAIISWTEDTRAQIFSESLSTCGLSEAQWKEVENDIATKFKEFEAFAAAGWELVAEEHFLNETIKERMDELQSMLGWVMVRWQAQSSQKEPDSKNGGRKTQDSTSSVSQNYHIKGVPEGRVPEADHTQSPSVSEGPPAMLRSLQDGSSIQQHGPDSEVTSTTILSVLDVLPVHEQTLKGTEKCMSFEMDGPKETLVLEPSETSVLLRPQPGPGSLGGTVNLIVSIGKKGEKGPTEGHTGATPPEGEEAMHKVSAYLPLKEKDGGGMLQSSKRMPTTAHTSPLPSVEGCSGSTCHTLPRSNSLLQNLRRKSKGKTDDSQLLTLQGIMGSEPEQLHSVQEKSSNTPSTWPPKCCRSTLVSRALWPLSRDPTDYVKNPLAQAIDAECESLGKASGWRMFLRQSRSFSSPQSATETINTCQHLSLGSVLSLEFPKDPTVLRNVQDAIRVVQQGAEGRKEGSQACGVAQGNADRAKTWENRLQKRALGKAVGSGDASQNLLPKDGGSTWFEEVNFNPSYSKQKAHCVTTCRQDRGTLMSQRNSSDAFLDFRQNQPFQISMLHEQRGWEWDKLAAPLGTAGSTSKGQAKEQTVWEATVKHLPSPAMRIKNPDATSNTTKDRDSAVNEIPKKESAPNGLACAQGSFVKLPPSLLHFGFKSPAKMAMFECELGHQEHIPASSGLGSPVLPPEGNATIEPKLPDLVEVCHPAHELFEEEEEELQAIWNNVEMHKKSDGVHCGPGRKINKAQRPDSSDGKPILTSEENVLVAKFKLPSSVQQLQGTEGERGTSSRLDGRNGLRWCSASFPSCQEPSERTDTTCPMDEQKCPEGGRGVVKINPSKLELQMMEGTLERKHLFQVGGRKANCRSWNTFHTVLMRQTLCFYQDKKDTLKSSVVAPPLNLSGATCTPETEYIKKNNCFALQLKDGSKYLLRAPTEPLKKEWISKLQQNSGLPEVDYFHSASQIGQGTTPVVSQEAMILPSSHVKLKLPHGIQDDSLDSGASQAGKNHKPAATYATEHSPRQCSPSGSPRPQDPFVCQEEDCGLVTSKKRSHSFTSATYQKITPLSMSKERLGIGSRYSVTLYIGEQEAAPVIPRPRCHSFMAASGGAQETFGERSQGASPRQKNKSVFRKFFGKRD